jgi:putative oxidoreductase
MKKLLSRPWISPSTAVFLLRVGLAIVFFAHGSQKMLGWFGGKGFAATTGVFVSTGIPTPLAWAAIFAEFFGSILLATGFLTRLGALAVATNMIVAIGKVHLSKGFFNPTGFEFPLTLLFAAVVVFLYGPGLYSIDAIIARNFSDSAEVQAHRHAA